MLMYEFTHDSIFVGEDGPTHQPVEHTMSLRNIPNLLVFRPADALETFYCFKTIMKNQKILVQFCLLDKNYQNSILVKIKLKKV